MDAVTDQTSQFSAAVALIYETIIGETKRAAMEQALCALLQADELLFTFHNIPHPRSGRRKTADDLYNPKASGPQEEASHVSQKVRAAGHILSIDVFDRGNDKLKLLVLRNPGRVPFSDHDLAWLSLLRPHLRNAAFVKSLIPDDLLGCSAGSHLVRSMSEGLIITTADGTIEWLNPTAQNILAAGQGLANVNGRLRAARAFEAARIKMLIREAVDGRSGSMLVDHASMWLPYGLVFAPLEFDFRPATTTSNAYQSRSVLVTIKDMRQHVDVIVERLTDVFGLSKAEQRIGALLLTGSNLQAAATTMGKSITTVKKQLRSMLTKTGARSQAELMSMFLSVPSLI
jgi:DNA-binding CsgD family transcriptional regulator